MVGATFTGETNRTMVYRVGFTTFRTSFRWNRTGIFKRSMKLYQPAQNQIFAGKQNFFGELFKGRLFFLFPGSFIPSADR